MGRWGMVGRIENPIVDGTGLAGPFDFRLEWTAPRSDDAGASEPGSTIFDALLKVGLKLERRKRPMPVIVIDRADRPMAN
jgi:uncharacterized protein (TIGR03435 family)